ncbi:MAG: gas vesicle protein K [Chloroflexi bacterium]|nr:gas vesicle protein K [Chloroflexota bacterium]
MTTNNEEPLRLDQRLSGDLAALDDFAQELSRLPGVLPRRIAADRTNVEQGLAKLVLTLIELLRRLLERQAVRRVEAGSLTEEQVEHLGEAFLKLEQKMAELKAAFGLEDEDLNLNLGPLGDLL